MSIQFCKYLNEINNSDIEYYLEYCLDFYEEQFLPFLQIVYDICLQKNITLRKICRNYLIFSGRKDREQVLENIFKYVLTLSEENIELTQCLNNIKKLEKDHILKCYDLARNEELFCDDCMPICWMLKEKVKIKGKSLKMNVK